MGGGQLRSLGVIHSLKDAQVFLSEVQIWEGNRPAIKWQLYLKGRQAGTEEEIFWKTYVEPNTTLPEIISELQKGITMLEAYKSNKKAA